MTRFDATEPNHHNRSGQFIWYIKRSTQFVIDTDATGSTTGAGCNKSIIAIAEDKATGHLQDSDQGGQTSSTRAWCPGAAASRRSLVNTVASSASASAT